MKKVKKMLQWMLPFLRRKKAVIIKASPHSAAEACERVQEYIRLWYIQLRKIEGRKKLSPLVQKSIRDTIHKIELAKLSNLNRHLLRRLAVLAQKFQKLLTPPHQPD